ncbi:helix-turn-helix domain-containing protein [soil metagenome]
MMTEDEQVTGAMTALESDDPAEALRGVIVLRRLAESLEETNVQKARLAGWTWEEIGDALGVSRQAVHKKYRRKV